MRILWAAALALVQLRAQPFSQVKGGDVWLTKDIKWEKAPKWYNPNLSSGVATILYFRADGRFGLMHCRVNKGLNYLVVSSGDGQVVYEGTWKSQGSDTSVRFRLTERPVPKVGAEQLPGPEQTLFIGQIPRKRGHSELRLDGKLFVPAGDRIPAHDLYPEIFTF